jgi:high-affinity Fe2+/Pb2+ permease
MIDAFRRASLYNHALAGGREIDLPDDISLPTFRGSIIGGVAIAAVGAILLLNTRFGMSLAWVEQWWPAAILLFGVYLVWKGVQERQKQQARESTSDDL